MKDTDLMPFGKHKGIAMANVPASYLFWLWENASVGVRKGFPQVFHYIKDNLQVIKQQMENER